MARKQKQREHNEWFRPVSLGNRKSCPSCKRKLPIVPVGLGLTAREQVWSWGEYVNAKWRTVDYFCQECFRENVAAKLLAHTGDCGCTINLIGYRCELPDWLTLRLPDIVAAESRHSMVGGEHAEYCELSPNHSGECRYANGDELCPVCGVGITIVGETTNGRFIGSCGDAFTREQWESVGAE